MSLVRPYKSVPDAERARQITDWLNCIDSPNYPAKSNTALSRARVRGLIVYLQEAESLLEKYEAQTPPGQETHDYWDFCPVDLQNAMTGADNLLQEYPRYPMVEIYYPGDEGTPNTHARLDMTAGTICRRPSGEVRAVYAIEHLFKAGLVSRIEQCECGTYFYAKRIDQKSCSAKCRHKIYEKKPEAQAKRKDYLRDYYRLKKSGKVK